MSDGTDYIRVVGYRTAQLEASVPSGVLPDAAVMTTTPVAFAGPCDIELPEPTWTFHRQPDGTEPVVGGIAERPLTAGWLHEYCPRPDLPAIGFDVSCRPGYCGARLSAAGDSCTFAVDLSPCEVQASLLARVRQDGTWCAWDLEPSTCEATPATGDASLEFTCDGDLRCTVHGYAPRPRSVRVETATVVEVPSALQDAAETPVAVASVDDSWSGYLIDFVVLEDRIVVAAPAALGWVARNCPTRQRTEFHVFDLDLSRIATTTAPPCLRRLERDVSGRGFYGLSVDGGWPAITHFDGDGTRTASVVVAEQPLRDPIVAALEVTEAGGGHVLAGLAYGELDVPRQGVLRSYSLDLRTERGSRTVPDDFRPLTSTRVGPNHVAISDEGQDRALVVDFELLEPLRSLSPHRHATHARIRDVRYHEDSDQLFVTDMRRPAAVYAFQGSELALVARSSYFGADFVPVLTQPLPGGDELLVALWGPDQGERRLRTSVAVLSVREHRFVPGHAMVGRGPAARARSDGRGGTLLLMPWTGQLLRVSR